jgi:hypothetical protein
MKVKDNFFEKFSSSGENGLTLWVCLCGVFQYKNTGSAIGCSFLEAAVITACQRRYIKRMKNYCVDF